MWIKARRVPRNGRRTISLSKLRNLRIQLVNLAISHVASFAPYRDGAQICARFGPKRGLILMPSELGNGHHGKNTAAAHVFH